MADMAKMAALILMRCKEANCCITGQIYGISAALRLFAFLARSWHLPNTGAEPMITTNSHLSLRSLFILLSRDMVSCNYHDARTDQRLSQPCHAYRAYLRNHVCTKPCLRRRAVRCFSGEKTKLLMAALLGRSSSLRAIFSAIVILVVGVVGVVLLLPATWYQVDGSSGGGSSDNCHCEYLHWATIKVKLSQRQHLFHGVTAQLLPARDYLP